MVRFSANLGFLFKEYPLPEGIRLAKAANFHAVECHWPYNVPVEEVRIVLKETGLEMLGLNTRRGKEGDNGLAALPERGAEARAAIDEAIAYAAGIGCRNVHIMAGFAQGNTAHQQFLENLKYACDQGAHHGLTMLIEPLNAYDAPGYFLNHLEQAAEIILQAGLENLKLMFDCYHVGRTEGDLMGLLPQYLPLTGHIQFASVPDRGAPDHGDVEYAEVFAEIERLGWDQPLGAEYKPMGETMDTLSWMNDYR